MVPSSPDTVPCGDPIAYFSLPPHWAGPGVISRADEQCRCIFLSFFFTPGALATRWGLSPHLPNPCLSKSCRQTLLARSPPLPPAQSCLGSAGTPQHQRGPALGLSAPSLGPHLPAPPRLWDRALGLPANALGQTYAYTLWALKCQSCPTLSACPPWSGLTLGAGTRIVLLPYTP